MGLGKIARRACLFSRKQYTVVWIWKERFFLIFGLSEPNSEVLHLQSRYYTSPSRTSLLDSFERNACSVTLIMKQVMHITQLSSNLKYQIFHSIVFALCTCNMFQDMSSLVARLSVSQIAISCDNSICLPMTQQNVFFRSFQFLSQDNPGQNHVHHRNLL